jgi:hypothetical protein
MSYLIQAWPTIKGDAWIAIIPDMPNQPTNGTPKAATLEQYLSTLHDP